MTVAALYVETNGVYYGLDDVDTPDAFRDVLLDMARSVQRSERGERVDSRDTAASQ